VAGFRVLVSGCLVLIAAAILLGGKEKFRATELLLAARLFWCCSAGYGE
jgi:hypothetical protein